MAMGRMPRGRPSLSSSAVTCRASSRVGQSTRTCTLGRLRRTTVSAKGSQVGDFAANGPLFGVPQSLDDVERHGELAVLAAGGGHLVVPVPFGQKLAAEMRERRVFARFGQAARCVARALEGGDEVAQ